MTSQRGRILVVDDDASIRQIVSRYLVAEQFAVTEAVDGTEAIRKVVSGFDLIVLDIAMPGIDGLEVLRQVRGRTTVPVILLTARTDEVDVLVGLSLGADDYITKPFSPRQLVARVHAVLRRTQGAGAVAGSDVLQRGDLQLNLSRREVTLAGVPVELTAREFDLLAALASSPGRVFSRRQLLEQVWGYDYYGDDRVIDVHIRNLRKALGDSSENSTLIATVRAVGYKFVGAAT
jgi:DNA-binding response OmpR family regulator